MGSDPRVGSTMVIHGIAIEMTWDMLTVGLTGLQPTLNEHRAIQHRAYESQADSITAVVDTLDLSWVVGAQGVPERLNLDRIFHTSRPDEISMKYLSPSERLVFPLLRRLRDGHGLTTGTSTMCPNVRPDQLAAEALDDWNREASAKDPARHHAIRYDPHVWAGVVAACRAVIASSEPGVRAN